MICKFYLKLLKKIMHHGGKYGVLNVVIIYTKWGIRIQQLLSIFGMNSGERLTEVLEAMVMGRVNY